MGAKNSTEKMLKNIDNLLDENNDSKKNIDDNDFQFLIGVGKKDKKEKKNKKEDKKNEPKKCKQCGEK